MPKYFSLMFNVMSYRKKNYYITFITFITGSECHYLLHLYLSACKLLWLKKKKRRKLLFTTSSLALKCCFISHQCHRGREENKRKIITFFITFKAGCECHYSFYPHLSTCKLWWLKKKEKKLSFHHFHY